MKIYSALQRGKNTNKVGLSACFSLLGKKKLKRNMLIEQRDVMSIEHVPGSRNMLAHQENITVVDFFRVVFSLCVYIL